MASHVALSRWKGRTWSVLLQKPCSHAKNKKIQHSGALMAFQTAALGCVKFNVGGSRSQRQVAHRTF